MRAAENDVSRTADIVSMETAIAKRDRVRAIPDDAEGVGPALKAAREADGVSLADAAKALRIREGHLEAIEAGAYADLPGRAFAIGFVKAYAQHLGFEPQAAAARLRDDAGWSELEAKSAPKPAAPTPVAERRDARAMWPIVLVLGFVLWCGWQITRPANDPGDIQLTGFPPPAERPAQPEPEADDGLRPQVIDTSHDPVAATIAAADPETASSALENLPEGSAANASASEETPSAPEPTRSQVRTPPATRDATTRAPQNLLPSAGERAAEQDATTDASEAAQPVEAVSEPAEDELETPAAAPQTAPQERVVVTPPPLPSGRMLGSPGSARVVVRAIIPGFLRIEDSAGRIVFAERVEAGDRYHVPTGQDLRLTALNGGGFDIIVDGSYAGAVGSPGEVVRGRRLDPDTLGN